MPIALFEKPWIARSASDKSTIIVLAEAESLEIAELQVDELAAPESAPRNPLPQELENSHTRPSDATATKNPA